MRISLRVIKIYAMVMTVLAVIAVAFFALGKRNIALALPTSDDGLIKEGIFAGDVSLAGMTGEEADKAIDKYVSSLENCVITLKAVDGNTVETTAGELGLYWKNTEIAEEAQKLGRQGNIVKRFKELSDLKRNNKVYDIQLGFEDGAIRNVVEDKCLEFNQEAIDATLKRENGEFSVTPGQDGIVVNVDESVSKVRTYMETLWKRSEDSVELAIETQEPKGRTEDLGQIKDVLGTYTTSFKTSASGRSANVRNGCKLINGTLLYPGEQLSVYGKVSPFTEENGYYLAGSYLNGLVVESLGGGICQVSSTLYNAVIRAELQVDQRSNHSMVVTYVDLSADAAISGTEKDFKFTNTLDYPIYIDGYTTDDKKITFTIYGKEERPANRTLEFETEKISETEPEGEKIIADPGQPVGYMTSQAAHTGYKANYWKIVKVDGKETERVQLNSSYYMAVPRTVTYGTAGDVTGAMAAAIATQSSDFCSGTAAQLVNAANAANIAAAQDAAAETASEAID